MSGCNWEAIHGFVTPGEFKRFCSWIESQIVAGMAEEIPVGRINMAMPAGFEERWFKCCTSGEVWRRVTPEFPFRGLWEPVDE